MADMFPINAASLPEAVIKTIAFFDLFDYPLTPLEIRNYLGEDRSLSDVRRILKNTDRLAERQGFYFLAGREEIVGIRQQRHNYAARKIRIARRFARLFSLCPWVKSVTLANSIGAFNLRDGSDIDFFIITAPGRIWLSRLYCTGLAKLLGRRPTAREKRDKICLSFYLSADRLAIGDLRLAGADPYFDEWRRQLVLLYNKNNTYECFLAANRLLPVEAAVVSETPNFSNSFLESAARFWQLRIMPAELKAANHSSDGVVISDQVLKFYQRDRRREFREKYVQKIQELFKKND